MSVKDPAIIYLKYDGDQLVLSDNEGHHSEKNKQKDFTTNVSPNGKVAWEIADKSISEICAITIDTGKQIFKEMPFEKKGIWEAKIDDRRSEEAKYSITFVPAEGGKPITVDPVIKIKP